MYKVINSKTSVPDSFAEQMEVSLYHLYLQYTCGNGRSRGLSVASVDLKWWKISFLHRVRLSGREPSSFHLPNCIYHVSICLNYCSVKLWCPCVKKAPVWCSICLLLASIYVLILGGRCGDEGAPVKSGWKLFQWAQPNAKEQFRTLTRCERNFSWNPRD